MQNPNVMASAPMMPPSPPYQSPLQSLPGAPVIDAPKSAPPPPGPPKNADSGPPDGLQIESPMSGCFYSFVSCF